MLTYHFEHVKGPIYLYLYMRMKEDIISGKLKSGEKLPSKRTFAENSGLSTITIQNAYDQLISEGYVYTIPKKGYYVARLEVIPQAKPKTNIDYAIKIPERKNFQYDFSDNGINPKNFPFSVWTKISRDVMSNQQDALMEVSPSFGVRDLREAIANHLQSFRGMEVDPNQIVIGAGTEYLYSLVIELLGDDKKYTLENPGYRKLEEIYKRRKISCGFAAMDEDGVRVDELEACQTDVAHICPNHHYPTGITMPASRRYELLGWANKEKDHYIIEDDYDSEFRVTGKPIPPLYSMDVCEKVIYMNTFSKSLSPTIRISYMVLPVHLANRIYEKMSSYSCTVSNFEQYTLAKFISQGHFERHINRMRLYYSKKRRRVIEYMRRLGGCKIIENDAGLHFLIEIETRLSDEEVKQRLLKKGIRIQAVSDYYFEKKEEKQHFFIINYSNLDEDKMKSLDLRME